MILVDTSVWIDHLRIGDPDLAEALNQGQVVIHPFVMGELACGNLVNRREVLSLLKNLPVAPRASDEEALFLIEHRSLMGRGIGYIDLHLLASALLEDVPQLWTRDRRLAAVAEDLVGAVRAAALRHIGVWIRRNLFISQLRHDVLAASGQDGFWPISSDDAASQKRRSRLTRSGPGP